LGTDQPACLCLEPDTICCSKVIWWYDRYHSAVLARALPHTPTVGDPNSRAVS
jgi:hypothetical protein